MAEAMSSDGVNGPVLRPVRKSRVSDEVLVQLTNLILEGAFNPGDKLPAERELAGRLAVNRTSLREALRRMESMGLVQIKPGDGVFVLDHNMSTGLEFLKFLLASGIGLDLNLIRDLAEIRRVFAVGMIELAAKNLDDEILVELQRIVDEYPSHDEARRLAGDADFEFFFALARATGNKVFIYMLNTIRDVFRRMSVLYYQVQGDPGTAAGTYGEIVDALRDRDAVRAVQVFEERMRLDDELLSKIMENAG